MVKRHLHGLTSLPGRLPGRAMASLMGLVILVMVGTVASMLRDAYDERGREARVETENLALAISQDLTRAITSYDLAIKGVIDDLHRPDVMGLPSDLKRAVLFDRAALLADLGSILVLSPAGDVVMDSRSPNPKRINYAGQDFFAAHQHAQDQHAQDQQVQDQQVQDQQAQDQGAGDLPLFVSRPYVDEAAGEWMIAFSRRLDGPGTTFAGAVVGSMRLAGLQDMLAQLKLGEHGATSLIRTDGTLIMRAPYVRSLIGRDIHPTALLEAYRHGPDGAYESVSAIDGVSRIYHYTRIGSLPLVQSVAVASRDVYATWWSKSILIGSVTVTSSAIMAALVACLVIELRRRRVVEHRLSELAQVDPLTGVANRRRFDETFDVAWRRSQRDGSPLSLLMIDADQFKAYNDSLGHLSGDRVLQAIAACAQACLSRPGDLVARYGGEEFVALLPATDAAGAKAVGDAIRERVFASALPHAASAWKRVSVSIGAATSVVGRYGSKDALVEAADEALYASKAKGRNWVTVASPGKARTAAAPALDAIAV